MPAVQPLAYWRDRDPFSLVHAMRRYAAMLDAIRDGLVKREAALIPDDLAERARHLKAFGYFQDASQAGACALDPSFVLAKPIANPDIEALSRDLRTQQTKTLAAGIDLVMAELKESMEAPPRRIDHHTHCLVFLYEYPRDPKPDEPGAAWIKDCQAHRAAVRAAETVVVLANYIRLLGYEARGHTPSATDIDLNRAAVACGLTELRMSVHGNRTQQSVPGHPISVSRRSRRQSRLHPTSRLARAVSPTVLRSSRSGLVGGQGIREERVQSHTL